jgi:ribonuclease HII
VNIKSFTVAQIKELAERNENRPDGELLQAMALDKRSSVQTLYKHYLTVGRQKEANIRRLEKMKTYECSLKSPGDNLVAGVDEAGRGPLAGPVVAAAVILPEGFLPEELDDSKKLTPVKRAGLDVKIKKNALAWAVGIATVSEIELYNIHQATMLAMLRAVSNLDMQPELVLVDGKFIIPRSNLAQKAVTGGDGLCPSIAAASVVAKVTRDRLMQICHLLYPEYGFDAHKGYGTAAHMTALSIFGPCPLHRRDFAPIKQLVKDIY